MRATSVPSVPDPTSESSDGVFVAATGSKLEDHLSAHLTGFVAGRRSPGETVTQTELDHAHKPNPFVAVRKRMILDKSSAQHRGFYRQVG
jgi:hypothetical protein